MKFIKKITIHISLLKLCYYTKSMSKIAIIYPLRNAFITKKKKNYSYNFTSSIFLNEEPPKDLCFSLVFVLVT